MLTTLRKALAGCLLMIYDNATLEINHCVLVPVEGKAVC